MKNWKLITIAVSLILVAIIVFQNTEEVTTKILLLEIQMPRAVLLIGTFAIGFAVGVLFTIRKRKGLAQSEPPEQPAT